MQVLKITVNLTGIGERAVDIVEIADNELSPIDESVELLGLVAHHLAIGIIQGEHLFNVGCRNRPCQFGDELIDRGDTGQQTGFAAGQRCYGLLQIVGKKLAATAIGEYKTIILKAADIEIALRYLL